MGEDKNSTGPDWFLSILNDTRVKARAALQVTLWRNWSVRNDLTHGGTSFSILVSVQVVESMLKNWTFRESEMPLDDVACHW